MKNIYASTNVNKHSIHLAIITVFFIFIICYPCSARAQTQTYTEDFTTTTYKDADNTTALWDTEKGEITLAPFRPFKIGGFDTEGISCDIAVSGNYAYVADFLGGDYEHSEFKVLGINDPANIISYGGHKHSHSNDKLKLVVDGDWLYTLKDKFFIVHDISNPTQITHVNTLVLEGLARGIAIAGEYAFIGNDDIGLTVIDIRDPKSPSVAKTCDTDGYAHGVAISGNYAFVADYENGLVVFDISTPSDPKIAGNYSSEAGGQARDVYILADHAFVANGTEGLAILDILDPENPGLVTNIATGDAYALEVSANHAYVADNEEGLVVINVQDPSEPYLVGGYSSPGECREVTLDGHCAYLASGSAGIEIIQISNPVHPYPVASNLWIDESFAADFGRMAFFGNILYITGHPLLIVDISDPTDPMLIATVEDSDLTGDYFNIEGNFVYCCTKKKILAHWVDLLEVIDLSDPLHPQSIASLSSKAYGHPLTSFASDPLVAVVGGNYCYVRTRDGLEVVDIHNPSEPKIVGSLDQIVPVLYSLYDAYTMVVEGSYAYITSENSLFVVDISDPKNPTIAVEVSGSTLGYNYLVFKNICISGNYAYIKSNVGLLILSIVDPTNPELKVTYPLFYCDRLERIGDLLYAYCSPPPSYDDYVKVYDISDPESPQLIEITYLPNFSGVKKTAVNADFIYLSRNYLGLNILRVSNREKLTPCVAQSKPIVFELWFRGAQLLTKKDNAISWQLSSDEGENWWGVDESGGCFFGIPGNILLWKATLDQNDPDFQPACNHLKIRPLLKYPVIDVIKNERRIRKSKIYIAFTRSAYDMKNNFIQVPAYGVYRWIDDDKFAEKMALELKFNRFSKTMHPQRGLIIDSNGDYQYIDWHLVEYEGAHYLISVSYYYEKIMFPRVIWELVTVVPASQRYQYKVELPTKGIGSKASHSRCYVIAAYNEAVNLWYISPLVSGGPVNNIPSVYKELLD